MKVNTGAPRDTAAAGAVAGGCLLIAEPLALLPGAVSIGTRATDVSCSPPPPPRSSNAGPADRGEEASNEAAEPAAAAPVTVGACTKSRLRQRQRQSVTGHSPCVRNH